MQNATVVFIYNKNKYHNIYLLKNKYHTIYLLVILKNIYYFLSHVFNSLENVRNRRILTYEWTSAAAAAAAKSFQSCPTLCDPVGSSPPGSPILGFSKQEYLSGLPLTSPMNGPLK